MEDMARNTGNDSVLFVEAGMKRSRSFSWQAKNHRLDRFVKSGLMESTNRNLCKFCSSMIGALKTLKNPGWKSACTYFGHEPCKRSWLLSTSGLEALCFFWWFLFFARVLISWFFSIFSPLRNSPYLFCWYRVVNMSCIVNLKWSNHANWRWGQSFDSNSYI